MKKQKKKVTVYKRLLSAALVAVMIMTLFPVAAFEKDKVEAADITLSNPRIVKDASMEAGQKVTWDCVWFGSYPQAEVVPSGEYTALDEKWRYEGDVIVSDSIYSTLQSTGGWDANNEITLNGTKYRRMTEGDATNSDDWSHFYNWTDSAAYHYFQYGPIKWRVLRTDGKQVLLLSDVALDTQRYHQEYHQKWEYVTWESSMIRSWLNGYGAGSNQQALDYSRKNFIDSAFTAAEQAAISDSTVENADNINYGTEGGNNTTDKIFLLSESEVWNTDRAEASGFVKNRVIYDEARRCKSSTYAKAMGIFSSVDISYAGNCVWCLRTLGSCEDNVLVVGALGGVSDLGNPINYYTGVRAALNLNLSSSHVYTYAGTVCSDGTITESDKPVTSVDTSYLMGTLTGIDALTGVYIGNICCPAADEFNFSQAANKLKKEVICKIVDGKVTQLKAVSEYVDLDIVLSANPEQLRYSSSKEKWYLPDSNSTVKEMNIQAKLVCNVNKSLPENIRKKIAVQLKKISLSVNNRKLGIYMKKGGVFSLPEYEKEIEASDSLSAESTGKTYDFTAYLTNEFSSSSVNEVEKYFCTADYSVCGEEKEISKTIDVAICNQDEQVKQSYESEREKAYKKLAGALEKEGGIISLNQQLKSDFNITDAQFRDMQSILSAYILSYITVLNSENSEAREKALDLIGFKKPLFGANSYTLQSKYTFHVGGQDIVFNIQIGCNEIGNKINAVKADFTYQYKGSDVVAGAYVWTDQEGFNDEIRDIAKDYTFDSMKDLLGIEEFINSTVLEGYWELAELLMEKTVSVNTWIKNQATLTEGECTLVTGTEKKKKMTISKIGCPVDVYVYDEDGNLCGAIVNNVRLTEYDRVYMSVIGDEKQVYLFDDTYTLKLVGTDTGTMDYTVLECNEEGKPLRTIEYLNVPLSNGKTYFGKLPKSESLPSMFFDLYCADSSKVSATKETWAEQNNPSKENPSVTPTVSIKKGDTFKLSGSYYKVTAVSKTGITVQYLKPASKKVKRVTIPAVIKRNDYICKVTAIAPNALIKCKKLKSVTIGKNVTSIGKAAFKGCKSLAKIAIPANVKTIGKQAFSGCKKLKKIIIKTTKLTNKTVGSKAFSGIHSRATVKVPSKKRKSYKVMLKKKGLNGKRQKVK